MAYKVNFEERVPTQGLREAVLRQVGRGETTLAQIALFSGYIRSDKARSGDTTGLQRALGMMHRNERDGKDPETGEQLYRQVSWCTIAETKGLDIMHALNLDPVDVGF